jgi:hypothetical protein
MVAILVSYFFAGSVYAGCLMASPEETLQCYERFTDTKDIESLKEIYWGLQSFQFPSGDLDASGYIVIERKVYEDDLDLENWGGEIPIWAKKGNVELISIRWFGQEAAKFSHIFREIDGKWYMVGHHGHTPEPTE